jgi:uncharacterized protein (DUF885 family)
MCNPLATAAGSAILVLAISPGIFAASQSADARFKTLYTREWAWREQQFPGLREAATHHLPAHLPRLNAASQAMRLAYWRDVMKQLDAIPYNRLSPKQQVNYDVYRFQIEVLINGQRFRDYEMPLNADSNFWTRFDGTQQHFRSEQDYWSWISQLRDVPRYFREEADNMRAGEERGFDQPQVTMEGRDDSLNAVAREQPSDTPMYAPFKTMPDFIPAADQAKMRTAALDVILSVVQPAYARLYTFLHDEYIPHCRTTIDADALPDGKAYYQAKILEFTTLDDSAEEIHKIGLAEVARLHQQMIDQMHQTGFQGGFPAFLEYLRTDPRFYAKTPLEYLKDAAWIAKEFDGKTSQYFGRLPRARFAIKPVPASLAPFYTSGRAGPGAYLVNTYDLPHRPLYDLIPMTLHESAPGHELQMALAAEDKSLPDFRRYTYISAYGEGWAVYCEWLGLEMGMYKTPYDRFGMLCWQVWRAARLVVDTGIHSEGWTRQQAIDYLLEYTALPKHEIETEVDRYIAWPGQALSYYVGAMAIREDRAQAEAALGPKFNIRAFHDAVLSLGSVPLTVLNKQMAKFIANGGVGPYPAEEK